MDALPFSRTKLVALIAAGATLAATAPKRAAAHEAVQATASGPLAAIAAGPGRLFALSGLEVLTFDDDGQPLGRCAGFAAPPQSERRAPIGAPDADEVLSAAGLEDDDSAAAEEALEDEGLGPKRRPRPRPDSGILPRALAPDAGADGAVWIATSSGIFRGDERGCRPAGLDGRDLLFVAAAGSTVVAATEDLLFRWAGDPDAPDTGDAAATFTVAAGLAERPRPLALGGDGAATRILDRPVDALAICGGEALALADDGVTAGRPAPSPRAPP